MSSSSSVRYRLLSISSLSDISIEHFEKYYPLPKVSYNTFAFITSFVPLASFAFCVLWSIMFHFEDTVYTDCHVDNLLPSLSSATGSHSPEIEVWFYAIASNTLPRVAVFCLYFTKHQSPVILAINMTELLSIFGLAFFNSRTHFLAHAFCFGLFVTISSVYLFIGAYSKWFLWSKKRKLKKIFAWVNASLTLLAICLFFRHEIYCEPYVYTFFALCEYLLLINNFGYHFLAYFDLITCRAFFITNDHLRE